MCKGSRSLCGNVPCPLLARMKIIPEINKSIGTEFFGPSTSVFVGRVGYPNIFAGPMAAIELSNIEKIDSPSSWFGMNYSDVVQLRSMLLRSKYKENIFSRSRFIENVQELALASKPTDIELAFKKKPVYSVEFSDMVQPMGPSASLVKLSLAENVKIPAGVDKVVNDDLKANEASFVLYEQGHDVYKITTVLSSGILGLEKNKKLVPTRWSITAVDDILYKQMLPKIREFTQVGEYRVYSSEYLDNHFEIMIMPGSWEYENFEAWAPGTAWTSGLKKPEILEEYESYYGRTTYADKEGGGYYAARLGVTEFLYKSRLQARVVVFREIHEGYMIPLGVWIVRETVRQAFKQPPKKFSTKEEALKHIKSRLRLPVEDYVKQSKILRQKGLSEFFSRKGEML
jgi:hypothetical protein